MRTKLEHAAGFSLEHYVTGALPCVFANTSKDVELLQQDHSLSLEWGFVGQFDQNCSRVVSDVPLTPYDVFRLSSILVPHIAVQAEPVESKPTLLSTVLVETSPRIISTEAAPRMAPAGAEFQSPLATARRKLEIEPSLTFSSPTFQSPSFSFYLVPSVNIDEKVETDGSVEVLTPPSPGHGTLSFDVKVPVFALPDSTPVVEEPAAALVIAATSSVQLPFAPIGPSVSFEPLSGGGPVTFALPSVLPWEPKSADPLPSKQARPAELVVPAIMPATLSSDPPATSDSAPTDFKYWDNQKVVAWLRANDVYIAASEDEKWDGQLLIGIIVGTHRTLVSCILLLAGFVSFIF
jgi:hypothetical protein